MIKKYFALSLITASLLAAGCSDDDDDDGGATTDGMTTDGTTTDGTTTTGTTTTGTTTDGMTTDGETTDGETTDGETTDGETTAGEGGETASVVDENAPEAMADDTSSYDVIAASPDHTILAGLLVDANLANTLDAGEFTIFAPTDTAFGEFFTANGVTEEALSADAGLEGILTYHVLAGSQDLATITTGVTNAAGTDEPFTLPVITAGVENSLTFETTADDASGGIDVVDSIDARAGLDEPLAGSSDTASGLVYSIDTVLTAPADDVETGGETVGTTTDGGTTDGPTTGGGNAGPVQTTLEGGDFETVSTILTDFLIKLDAETDPDPFTVLAISDAGLAGATVVLDDIVANGAVGGVNVGGLTAEELQAAGTLTTRNMTMYVIGGTDGENDLTIGGVDATLIGGTASQTYRLEGLPASQ
ncbi:fasciclin domain-containing protein [bacterium]|nr:fasciclin domain-containing protein [bacterium]